MSSARALERSVVAFVAFMNRMRSSVPPSSSLYLYVARNSQVTLFARLGERGDTAKEANVNAQDDKRIGRISSVCRLHLVLRAIHQAKGS